MENHELEKRIEVLEDNAEQLKQKLPRAFRYVMHNVNVLGIAIIGLCIVLIYDAFTQKGDESE